MPQLFPQAHPDGVHLAAGFALPHHFQGHRIADEKHLPRLDLGQIQAGGGDVFLNLARLQLEIVQGFLIHHQHLAGIAHPAAAVALQPPGRNGRSRRHRLRRRPFHPGQVQIQNRSFLHNPLLRPGRSTRRRAV